MQIDRFNQTLTSASNIHLYEVIQASLDFFAPKKAKAKSCGDLSDVQRRPACVACLVPGQKDYNIRKVV
jgi:hypothetical protein